jgi:hypothetical protein
MNIHNSQLLCVLYKIGRYVYVLFQYKLYSFIRRGSVVTGVKQKVMRKPKSSCIHVMFYGLPNGITVTNILTFLRIVSIPRNVHEVKLVLLLSQKFTLAPCWYFCYYCCYSASSSEYVMSK